MSCPSGGTHHRWAWIVVNGDSGVGWGGMGVVGSHTPGVPGRGGERETGNNFIKVHFRLSADHR